MFLLLLFSGLFVRKTYSVLAQFAKHGDFNTSQVYSPWNKRCVSVWWMNPTLLCRKDNMCRGADVLFLGAQTELDPVIRIFFLSKISLCSFSEELFHSSVINNIHWFYDLDSSHQFQPRGTISYVLPIFLFAFPGQLKMLQNCLALSLK